MGAKKDFLTNQFATLDSFVDKFMHYAVEHPSPKQGCSLNNVFDYSTKLSQYFVDVLELKAADQTGYVHAHAARKLFLRHEELTQKPGYYSNLGALQSDDDRTTFWRSKQIESLYLLAPDSNSYLSGIPPETTLFDLACR